MKKGLNIALKGIIFLGFALFLPGFVYSENPQDTINLDDFKAELKSIQQLYHYYGVFSGFDKKFSYEIANRFLELTSKIQINDTLYIQRELIQGDIYLDKGNYAASISHYKKAFLRAKDLQFPKAIVACVNSIGTLYSNQRKSAHALRYYKEGIKIAKQYKDTSSLIVLLGNLASAYYQAHDQNKKFLDTALLYDDTLLTLAENNRGEGDELQLANLYNKIGLHYTDAGKYEDAQKFLEKALHYSLKHQVTDEISYTHYYLGRLFNAKENFREALNELFAAQNLAIENEDYALAVDCDYELAQSYIGLKKFEEAIKLYEKFIQGNDSIIDAQTVNSINQLSALYESEKKQHEIFMLSEKNKNQQNIIMVSFFALATILMALLGLIKLYRQKNKLNNQLLVSYAEISDQKNILQKQNELIESKNREITDSIEYASRIQKSLLISPQYIERFFDQSFIWYKPKDIVSGDFYWVYFKEPYLYFVVADCTGHGVPGAFMSVLNITILNEIVVERGISDVDQIFNEARKMIIKSLYGPQNMDNRKDGMDAVIVKINLSTFEIDVVAANNPVWILPKNSEELIEIKPDMMPVGPFIENPPDFKLHRLKLAKGDRIFMFTDGLTDQFGGEKNKKFKYNRIRQILLETKTLSILQVGKELEQALDKWKGKNEQTDDVLLVGLQI